MLTGLNHITLTILDIENSLNFYIDLGFTAHVKWETGAYLSLGELWLCLNRGSVDENHDYSHFAFSVDESNFQAMIDLVSKLQCTQWKQNASEGESIYILDPDGHKLEIHTGDLASRLSSLETKPYKNMVWL